MTTEIGGYEVLGELGRGGMGRVLRVRHRGTGAVRALKLIDGFADGEALLRLRREGEAQARAGVEGVVPIHEAGVDRGRAFLVMSLMPGGSLRERVRRDGRVGWREACALLAPLARALARCHAAGLVHRDLKPENVLFDEEGGPRLADFGCVRDLGAASLTATGATIGTLAYMAPEQVDASKVGPPADVYALGLILHEVVAGERPFRHTNQAQLVREKVAPSRARPRLARAAGAPDDLDALIDRAMATRPEQRCTAAELAAELEALTAGTRRARRPRGPAAAGAAALAVVLVAGLLSRRDPPAASVGGPASPTPVVSAVAASPVEREPTERERIEALQRAAALLGGSRPAADAASLAVDALPGAPASEAEARARDELREAALARGRRRSQEREGDVLAALHDAMTALSLAARAGDDMERVEFGVYEGLARQARAIHERVKHGASADDLQAVGRLLADAAPAVAAGLDDSLLFDALLSLAETCDAQERAPEAADGAQVLLVALVGRRHERAKPPFVLGKLVANRLLASPASGSPARSTDDALIREAREHLREALRRHEDDPLSVGDRLAALIIAAHLAELDRDPEGALRLVEQALGDADLTKALEDLAQMDGANLRYVRARARLARGQAAEAAADLDGAADHTATALPGADFERTCREAAERLRQGADPARVLATLPRLGPR